MNSLPPSDRVRRDRVWIGLAACVCVVLAVFWASGVRRDTAWGWDETMHAEYPAARILLCAQDGDGLGAWHALHDCMRYPFVWPVSLAALQSVTGLSEIACRMGARVVWAAGLFALFLLARTLVLRIESARGEPVRNGALVPWLALAFGATSPLALSFSGTLFLEIPFTCVSIGALRAWLRRGEGAFARRELFAGAWIALAVFTKFNYGLLLAFGVSLAWLVELVVEVRAARATSFVRRSAWLALVPALAGLWWFVLPLPFGADMAHAHRVALVDFLLGNRDESVKTSWYFLPLNASCFLVWAPRVLVFLLCGAFATLALARTAPVRSLWIVWIASTLPVLLHPFHHDRFLLPGAVFLWVLAALGVARFLPRTTRQKLVVVPLCVMALALAPDLDSRAMLKLVGIDAPERRAYQHEMLTALRDLRPGRRLETNGFTRAESEALLDLFEPEVQADDRTAWVGMTQNFSPAALHVGLVARGKGSRGTIERGEFEKGYVDLGYVDLGWTNEQILDWSASFTLIVASDPIDLAGNPDRQWLARYRDALLASGRFERRELGEVTIVRPRGAVHSRVFALRRKSAR